MLLQPTEIDTQPAYVDSRRVGSVDGKTSSDSRISTSAAALCRARSSSTGSEPMLWVPKTTSTQGACLTISPRSFCARQPPTAICMPGCFVLDRAQVAEVAVEAVVGVLPDRAGVEHDDVGRVGVGGPHVAGVLQQAGDALGVVHVHLAAVGAHVVGAGGCVASTAVVMTVDQGNPGPAAAAGVRRRRAPVPAGAGRVGAGARAQVASFRTVVGLDLVDVHRRAASPSGSASTYRVGLRVSSGSRTPAPSRTATALATVASATSAGAPDSSRSGSGSRRRRARRRTAPRRRPVPIQAGHRPVEGARRAPTGPAAASDPPGGAPVPEAACRIAVSHTAHAGHPFQHRTVPVLPLRDHSRCDPIQPRP